MPSRLTTPTTLEAGLYPSEVGRRVGQWKYEIAPSSSPGSGLSFWTQRMPPSFRDNPPGGKLPVHIGRSLQYTRERLLGNLDRTARNSPSAVTPQPFHSTSATLYSHTRRPPPHPVSPRSSPRFGKGAPHKPPDTHTHSQAPASWTPSKTERVPGLAVLRDSDGAGAVPSRRRRVLLYPPAALASLFPRKGREERCGRGGVRRGAEGRLKPIRNL